MSVSQHLSGQSEKDHNIPDNLGIESDASRIRIERFFFQRVILYHISKQLTVVGGYRCVPVCDWRTEMVGLCSHRPNFQHNEADRRMQKHIFTYYYYYYYYYYYHHH